MEGEGCIGYNYRDRYGRILEDKVFFRSQFYIDKFLSPTRGKIDIYPTQITFQVSYHALKHLDTILHSGRDEINRCPPFDNMLIYNLSRIIQDGFYFTDHLSQVYINNKTFQRGRTVELIIPIHISAVLPHVHNELNQRRINIPYHEQHVYVKIVYRVENFIPTTGLIYLDIRVFSIYRCDHNGRPLYNPVISLLSESRYKVLNYDIFDQLNISIIYGAPPPTLSLSYLREGTDNIPKLIYYDEDAPNYSVRPGFVLGTPSTSRIPPNWVPQPQYIPLSPSGWRPLESPGTRFGPLPEPQLQPRPPLPPPSR